MGRGSSHDGDPQHSDQGGLPKKKLSHVQLPVEGDEPIAKDRPPYDYEVYEGGGHEMAQEHLPHSPPPPARPPRVSQTQKRNTPSITWRHPNTRPPIPPKGSQVMEKHQ